jgi:predicted DNA-binding antitoxin AbrB/MazE fold protein
MGNQVTDAIYSGGVLKPLAQVSLREAELVRLIIERKQTPDPDRLLALERLRAGIAQMGLVLTGPLPTRDELHDRI